MESNSNTSTYTIGKGGKPDEIAIKAGPLSEMHAAHELGHHMQTHNPKLREAETAYFNSRTAGEEAVPLGDGRDKTFVGKKDKWDDEYAGRVYPKESGFHEGCEVFTKGIEGAAFRGSTRKDADHVNWTLGMIAGHPGG